MARGHQKIQSQKKNQEKQSKQKKTTDHKSAAKKALIHTCPVCRSQMPDLKTFKQHFESKHPKASMPEELKEVP
ncbi:zinc finger protein 706-like [Clavelina lepadiformis]|uniref:zinc finger protein 706-like n=1 Tax=Clavelina lepadiformis TaxID=159417 RepID=UPI004041B977